MYTVADHDRRTLPPGFRRSPGRFPEIAEVHLCGSRARGDHKPRSDINLALKAPALADYLNEETLLPYFIDLVHYKPLEDAQLKERIDAQGVKIYSGTRMS